MKEKWSTGHPAFSEDGRTLYFASDRPGGSGGSDIWMSIDNGAGWGQPVNLGPAVNTAGNELFPTVNGDALYFSSTGHHNMGGSNVRNASAGRTVDATDQHEGAHQYLQG